jgi:hypothetical protein
MSQMKRNVVNVDFLFRSVNFFGLTHVVLCQCHYFYFIYHCFVLTLFLHHNRFYLSHLDGLGVDSKNIRSMAEPLTDDVRTIAATKRRDGTLRKEIKVRAVIHTYSTLDDWPLHQYSSVPVYN